jgi:hypothetical protein
MQTIPRTDARTGRALPPLILNDKLAIGDKFRLLGNTTVFEAVKLKTIIGEPAVVGVSVCRRFSTTARIADTVQVHVEPKRLYIEGHNHKRGYIVSVELDDRPPVRHYANLRRARRFVDRFNRFSERAAFRSH